VALAFCGLLAAAALVVPVTVLVAWMLRSPSTTTESVFTPALNSLLVSGLGAVAATAAALPIAVLAVRHRRRWTRLLDRASFAANALPGVVVGLALVFFFARYVPALYGTLAVLIAAYVIRFLPQALSSGRSALDRADPRLEEAARGLGRGSLSTLRSVTLPLISPGLFAGATLVFLSCMKELPATLLLRPIGFDTLPTEVWTATSVSAYAEAAPPALALIIAATPIVYLLTVRGGAGLAEPERATPAT
jgi:iron(III) transport system permease protein